MHSSATRMFDNIAFNVWLNSVYVRFGQQDFITFISGPATSNFISIELEEVELLRSHCFKNQQLIQYLDCSSPK